MGGKGAGVVHCRGRFFAGVFAGHFDEAAQGQQADFVIGIAVLESEEARPKAE